MYKVQLESIPGKFYATFTCARAAVIEYIKRREVLERTSSFLKSTLSCYAKRAGAIIDYRAWLSRKWNSVARSEKGSTLRGLRHIAPQEMHSLTAYVKYILTADVTPILFSLFFFDAAWTLLMASMNRAIGLR